MRVRITLGRVVAFVVLCALAFVAVTIVAITRDGSSESKRRVKTLPPPTKVVPGVIGQPYVFAESSLQQEGFGWKVVGPVAGWAGVTVSSQTPAPGTEVVDTGAPLITLRLVKPKGYVTQGTSGNSSPYASTKIVLPAGPTGTGQSTTSAQTTTTGTFSTSTVKSTSTSTSTPTSSQAETRPPAFTIAGAKSEPLDEIPLPQRAKNLNAWLDSHRQAGPSSERYWLFQHAWIVYGAKFGWWHGAQALGILIAVDKRVEALWGVGSKSEIEARSALEFVRAHSG